MQQLFDSPLAAAPGHLDRPAVVDSRRSWTWRGLHEASIELSRRLIDATTPVCTSRFGFLIPLLAALRNRCLLVLPPSGDVPISPPSFGPVRDPSSSAIRKRSRPPRASTYLRCQDPEVEGGRRQRQGSRVAARLGRRVGDALHLGQHRRAPPPTEDPAASGARRTDARRATGSRRRGRPRFFRSILCSVAPHSVKVLGDAAR